MSRRVFFEPIKELGFAGISAAYAALGAATTHETRMFRLYNHTEGHVYVTIDSSENQMFVAAGTFILYDLQANSFQEDTKYVLPVGTQFYVKQVTAPVSGSMYVECVY